MYGNNWKKILVMIGRDLYLCRDKWCIMKWFYIKIGLKVGNCFFVNLFCEKRVFVEFNVCRDWLSVNFV